MKQKLGLTCALIHTPKIVLLDEPTTGVDPVSRRDFWRILYDLREEGVTIVISTAYLDEAERCHRLALLHEGRLLQCDTPQALKARMPGAILLVASKIRRAARAAHRAPARRDSAPSSPATTCASRWTTRSAACREIGQALTAAACRSNRLARFRQRSKTCSSLC